jgi:hypothetical protein
MERLTLGFTILSSVYFVASASYSFMTLGDWGGAVLEEGTYKENTYAVAKQLALSSAQLDAKFIVSTGDNFYWCGLQNSSDFQIGVSWLNPYKDPALQVPWYSILGNHEYGYSVEAQLEMPSLYKNWIMDDRYYTRRIEISSGVYLSFIFIDSSPCVSEYRASNPDGWDPCSTKYPTCSITGGSDDFEGPCHFNENILTQDCPTQSTWFKNALNAVPSTDWLIVAGHHAADEIDVEDFVAPMQQRGVDLYLNGHSHTLSQYTIDGSGAYVTSGAGSLVNTLGETVILDHEGGTPAKDSTLLRSMGQPVPPSMLGHQYRTVFNQKVAGFTTHTFSSDFSQLTTNYVDAEGNMIHSFTVTRGQTYQP